MKGMFEEGVEKPSELEYPIPVKEELILLQALTHKIRDAENLQHVCIQIEWIS